MSLGINPSSDMHVFSVVREILSRNYRLAGIITPARTAQVISGNGMEEYLSRNPDAFNAQSLFIYERESVPSRI
jgi:hypothetical protein